MRPLSLLHHTPRHRGGAGRRPRTPAGRRRATVVAATLAAAALCGSSLTAAPPAAAQEPFALERLPDVDIPGSVNPRGLVVADLDSDGRQDLALLESDDDRILVRLGNGNGSFRAAPTVTGAAIGRDLVATDVNADGITDLVATRSNSVAAYCGKGDGTFADRVLTNLGTPLDDIVVADFTGDGRDDVAGVGENAYGIARGTGGCGFELRQATVLTGAGRAVAAGDFDGDAHVDLVVSLGGALPRIGVMRGRGDGLFETPRAIALVQQPDRLAVGDFDGDGALDVAGLVRDARRVRVLHGRGDGNLSLDLPDVPVAEDTTGLAVADLDGDGAEDLVTVAAAGTVSVHPGKGDGTFGAARTSTTAGGPRPVVAADLNADGLGDVATATGYPASISVLVGRSPAGAPRRNLLVNAGFEQGLAGRLPTDAPPIPGWTRTGGMTFVRYGAPPARGLPALDEAPRFGTGGLNVLWGGDSTGLGGVTTASQTVDVSASAASIDAGLAIARLSAWLGGGTVWEDHMSATAAFLGAGGAQIGAPIAIGPVTRQDRRQQTTLQHRAGTARVPAGTRRIRVTLTSVDTDTISSAIADNVRLTLDAPAPEAPPAPDAPPTGPTGDAPAVAGAPGAAATPRSASTPARFGRSTMVSLSLASRRADRRGRIRIRIRNRNPFAVTGTLTTRRPKLRATRFTVRARSTRTLTLTLPRRLRGRRLTIELRATVRAPGGSSRTLTLKPGARPLT
jgi:hypothetical protein